MTPTISLLPNKIDLLVKFPYSLSVISAIKADIPRGGYRWNKTEKAWIIHREFLIDICEILEKQFERFSLDRSCDAIFKEGKWAKEQ